MQPYKGNKNNKKPKLRINVKKGTASYIERKTMKQDASDQQRWEALRHKYERKEGE